MDKRENREKKKCAKKKNLGSHGQTYQETFTIHTFVRGKISNKNFRLNHELPEGEKFDDVIVETDNFLTLLQLKHKQTSNDQEIRKISPSNLLNVQQTGDFNLLKYVISAHQISKKTEYKSKNIRTVLFTNADIKLNENDQLELFNIQDKKMKVWVKDFSSIQLKKIELDSDDFLYTGKGKFYTFEDQNIVEILFRQRDCLEKENLKKIVKHLNKNINELEPEEIQEQIKEFKLLNHVITKEEIQKALKLIIYAVGQPDNEELGEIIKKDLKRLKFSKEVFNSLKVNMSDFCENRKTEFETENGELTLKTANLFFKNYHSKYSLWNILIPFVLVMMLVFALNSWYKTTDETLDESKNLLESSLKNIPGFKKEQFESLAMTLQYNHEALNHSINYIKMKHKHDKNCIQNYLEQFETVKKQFGNETLFDKSGNTKIEEFTPFYISLDTIEKEEKNGSVVIQILRFAAYMDGNSFDLYMIDSYLKTNKVSLLHVIKLLNKYSFMDDDDWRKIKITKFVQKVIRYKFRSDKAHDLEQALKFVIPDIHKKYIYFKKNVNFCYEYYKSIKSITQNQIRQLKVLKKYILADHMHLYKEYKKLFRDIDENLFEKFAFNDDVVNLKEHYISEEFSKSFVSRNIDTLIKKNCVKVIKYFIEYKIIDINKRDFWGNTLLHKACSLGSFEVMELLIEYGFDINTKNYLNETILHTAILSERILIINILIEKGANLNAQDLILNTPLHLAAKQNNTKIAKILIKNGAHVFVVNEYDETPLHYAIEVRNYELCELLLQDSKNIDKYRQLLEIIVGTTMDSRIANLLEDKGLKVERIKVDFWKLALLLGALILPLL